jgi:hypothetical protein
MPSAEQIEPAVMLPYDDMQQFPNLIIRVWKTIVLVLTHPTDAINRLSTSCDGPDSLSFLLAITWPIHGVGEVFKYLVSHWPFLSNLFANHFNTSQITFWNTFFSILFYPIGAWLGLWVCAGLNHLSLWAWRGLYNRIGINQTARVTGLFYGMTVLISIPLIIFNLVTIFRFHIPYATGAIMLFYCLLYGYILAKAHSTEIWRGIAASFTPPIVLFGTIAISTHQSFFKILFQ